MHSPPSKRAAKSAAGGKTEARGEPGLSCFTRRQPAPQAAGIAALT